jgi:hypothetical protein
MDTPLIHTSLSWPQAQAELRSVEGVVAGIFDDFYRSVSPEDRLRLQVAVVRYPYADKIIDSGYPYWPNQHEIPKEYIASRFLPFGFILDNCCEILDTIFTSGSFEQISRELLSPSGAIGLCELVESLTDISHTRKPEWNITAGATSIYALPNLFTRQRMAMLERYLGQSIDFSSSPSPNALIHQLSTLDLFNDIRRRWTVKVLYFSRAWFDLLQIYRDTPTAAAMEGHLVKLAWKALARVRHQRPNHLRERLNDLARGGINQTSLAESAASLLTCVDDILENRRPCFVPSWKDDNLGPFGAISAQVLEPVVGRVGRDGADVGILHPCYLSSVSSGTGYMRLDHASPTILGGRAAMAALDKVREIVSLLRLAARNVKGMPQNRKADFDLQYYIDLLQHVTFQTPPTRYSSHGPNFFKFTAENMGRPVQLTAKEFYAPYFLDDMPRERSAFFRNSFRISVTA